MILPYGYENKVIDFSANINPFGLSPNASKILKDFKKLKFFTQNYPQIYPEPFIAALSRYHGIGKEHILPGAGATDLIFNIINFLNPKTTVIVEPSFSEYERAAAAKAEKSKIIHIETCRSCNFELKGKSLSSLLKNIETLGKNDVVFAASPSNPAGTIINKEVIKFLLNLIKNKNAFLVLDESFMDFCEEFSSKSLLKKMRDYDNLIIIRSMTKFFAMPGQRLGYVFANPDITAKLGGTAAPWKITSLSAEIAVESLWDENYIGNTLSSINNLKTELYGKLKRLKSLEIIHGAANFILLKIKSDKFNAMDLKNYLLGCGVLIRYCGDYYGLNDKYFRIAVKKRTDNDFLIKKLKEFEYML